MFQGVLRLPPNAISSSGARQNLRWGATTGWCENGEKRFAEKWEKVQKNMDWLIDELFSFANFFSGTLGPFWALWQRCDSVWVSRGQLWVQICSKWISAFFFCLKILSCICSSQNLLWSFWNSSLSRFSVVMGTWFFLLRCPVLWKRLIGCVPESMKASLSHVSQLHRTPSNGNL